MNHFTRKRLFLLLPALLLCMAGCDKFQGSQTIPSYIQIDTIYLSTLEPQGTASHKITDAWVYVDNELIGAFQLPVTVPILHEGMHTVKVHAGVKMNGIASTRVAYPFFQPATYTLNLVQDSVIHLSPAVSYYNTVRFAWMENFESGGSSFEKTSKSDTSLVLSSQPAHVFEGEYSGLVSFGDSVNLFEAATIDTYTLPKTGAYVFLEMNYKTNNRLTVGLIGQSANQVFQQPCMVLNHSDQWNKIYINFTPFITDMTTALEFKIFIGALKEDGVVNPQILVDNFKLLHFE